MSNRFFVHQYCKPDYTISLQKKQKQENIIDENCVKSTALSSERKGFNWKHTFFFCGEACVVDKKHPNRSKCRHKVGTLSSQTSTLNKCHERVGKWADDISRLLSRSIDLVASDAIHHEQRESDFFYEKIFLYLRQRGQKLNTPLDAPRITQ